MGWQDAPLVEEEEAATGTGPAWMQAPVVEEAVAAPPTAARAEPDSFWKGLGTTTVGAAAEGLKTAAKMAYHSNPIKVGMDIAQGNTPEAAKMLGRGYEGMVEGSTDQFVKAAADPNLVSAAGHAAAGLLPGIGPAAAHSGELIAEGKWKEGLGEGVGLLASAVAPRVAGAVVRKTTPVVNRAGAAVGDAATKSYLGLSPGKNLKYKDMGFDVAREVGRSGEMAWTSEGMLKKLKGHLDRTGKAKQGLIDAAGDQTVDLQSTLRTLDADMDAAAAANDQATVTRLSKLRETITNELSRDGSKIVVGAEQAADAVPISRADTIKQQFQDAAKYDTMNKTPSSLGAGHAAGDVKRAVQAEIPGLQEVNNRYGALAKGIKTLEKTLDRANNSAITDPVSMSRLWRKTLGSTAVKSGIARAGYALSDVKMVGPGGVGLSPEAMVASAAAQAKSAEAAALQAKIKETLAGRFRGKVSLNPALETETPAGKTPAVLDIKADEAVAKSPLNPYVKDPGRVVSLEQAAAEDAAWNRKRMILSTDAPASEVPYETHIIPGVATDPRGPGAARIAGYRLDDAVSSMVPEAQSTIALPDGTTMPAPRLAMPRSGSRQQLPVADQTAIEVAARIKAALSSGLGKGGSPRISGGRAFPTAEEVARFTKALKKNKKRTITR
jgi:hypothetical protein